MRWIVLLFVIVFSFTTAAAQDQKRTLIDGLLRPNMELSNPAQGKTFTTDSKIVGQQQTPATFVTEPALKKTFGDISAAMTKEYSARSRKADLQQRSTVEVRDVDAGRKFASSSTRDNHSAYDAVLAVSGRRFSEGERSFRGEGKSQKSLNRQNPPLTIDQVRELLNKNR